MEKKILVVDDEPHIVKAIRFYLEDEDYEVLTAEAGEEAIDLAEKHQPDLIILDVMMPVMDGFEVCRELRSRSRTRLIPIIFLTARESIEDKVMGFDIGADDYITKPFNNRELLARIKSRIRRTEEGLSSNAVTGLPGGSTVEKEANLRLQGGKPFTALFILLDSFDHFRRAYGLNQSHQLQKFVARLLAAVMEEAGMEESFLGHGLEDEFVIFTTIPNPSGICERFFTFFEQGLESYLPEAARARSEVAYFDYKGNAVHAPLPRLLIAGLNTSNRFVASYSSLATWAAQVIMQARSMEGRALAMEE